MTYSAESQNHVPLPMETLSPSYLAPTGAASKRAPAGPGQNGQDANEIRPDDRQAFDQMFSAWRSQFVRMAYRILHNEADAEDAVQNACLSACLHLRTFQGRAALKTWFTRIVINAALMLRRKHKSPFIDPYPGMSAADGGWIENIKAVGPDPEHNYAKGEALDLVDSALAGLKPVLRQAFQMTYYEEMSSHEACTALGISSGTFKARLFRAKKQLFEQLDRSLVPPMRRVVASAAFTRRIAAEPTGLGKVLTVTQEERCAA